MMTKERLSGIIIKMIRKVCRKGIMQGRDGNRFAPKENATRAETAAIIQRLFETK